MRRENRRFEAREQLRTAYERLAASGMEAFAERARKELQATGEKVRKRTVEARDDLNLHIVFTKLGVRSRRELTRVLAVPAFQRPPA